VFLPILRRDAVVTGREFYSVFSVRCCLPSRSRGLSRKGEETAHFAKRNAATHGVGLFLRFEAN